MLGNLIHVRNYWRDNGVQSSVIPELVEGTWRILETVTVKVVVVLVLLVVMVMIALMVCNSGDGACRGIVRGVGGKNST